MNENVVQEGAETVDETVVHTKVGGEGWEMRMLYKDRRRGWGDEHVVQEWKMKVGRLECFTRAGGMMRMLYKSWRRVWEDENAVQEREERNGRRGAGGEEREMRMFSRVGGEFRKMRLLYKSRRRGAGDETVVQECEERV